MADSKKPTVASPSGAYKRMLPKWQMIDALLGGTETMREAGKTYLPQYVNESNKNYENRLASSVLLNMTEQTLDTLAGKPFREEVVLGEDTPDLFVEQAEDIDMQGSNLQAFCRNWFREGWAKGFAHVLVEHPEPEQKLDEKGQPMPRTLADDREEGLRPYWVHIKPECVIAAYADTVNGKEVLTHVRILETTVERDGWEERAVERVRVLEPGLWEIWAPDAKGDDWHIESSGTTSLDYIPLVTFYAGKKLGLMEAKPPLIDLAYLNVEHWQSKSNQRNVLTVARFPILAASGVPADQEVTIGPNSFLTTDDKDGKWYYVEHTGAAISAGQTDLDSLEDQMASYGAEYLRKRPGDETATGRALDSAESSSYLAATVRAFQDTVEQAMRITADWTKAEEAGSVKINSDVDMTEADATHLDTLNKARAGRDISRPAYLKELQNRGILSEDFDVLEDAEILAEESKDSLGDMFASGQGTGVVPPTPAPTDPTQVIE
ncbi:portal protein [Stenotrophomonas phage A1432]|uniref:Portal protein n=1 Tax=Stenotrophomonas phage A1432 TaxID=2930315 RepID=A0A9E7N1F7_9CAUD|nr:portal protein [Stenotrophomonas phage A1432]UTC27956.1 portal protein [Stenotrophomonas phage A1432]